MNQAVIQNNQQEVLEQPIVHAENLGKTVATAEGPLNILTSIDLSIKSGESVAIVGSSGSGKSTLLSLLAGLDSPTEGHVELAGISIGNLDEDGRAQIRSQHVGFVFQSFQLLPSMTALENVMLPLELSATPGEREIARALMRRVNLDDRLNHYPLQLSGGEQQRVAIARAFVTKPRILFVDEPTGNLDSNTGKQIIELLFELNRENKTTLVMVTHDENLAARCNRRIRLEAGQIL